MRFMNRQATPKVQALALKVAACQQLRRECQVPVHILHVPRTKNQLADWLSKLGGTHPGECDVRDVLPPCTKEDVSEKELPKIRGSE